MKEGATETDATLRRLWTWLVIALAVMTGVLAILVYFN